MILTSNMVSCKSHEILRFNKKKHFNGFFIFFGDPCSKNQLFSPNEELEGSKFGLCKNILWRIRKNSYETICEPPDSRLGQEVLADNDS